MAALIQERIRSPKLAVFIKGLNGVPMEEALRRADEAGLVIASNKRLSKVLVGSDEWRDIREVFTCWTGTMTAYDKPDQKLGKIIEYTDSKTGVRYVFPVPEEHQGKKNIILVAEHPDFYLIKDGNDRVVQAGEAGALANFPTLKKGWFLGDPKYDLPRGKKIDGNKPDARRFLRIDKRVGLISRDGWFRLGSGMMCVDLTLAPSYSLGVTVETPPEQVTAAARLIEQMKVK
ncbi:MAG: hypothetical protein AB1324_05115 [Candidatus Micrarchaeota archaeon]